jgi:hypothetical protein
MGLSKRHRIEASEGSLQSCLSILPHRIAATDLVLREGNASARSFLVTEVNATLAFSVPQSATLSLEMSLLNPSPAISLYHTLSIPSRGERFFQLRTGRPTPR